jgi:hypothetical protein
MTGRLLAGLLWQARSKSDDAAQELTSGGMKGMVCWQLDKKLLDDCRRTSGSTTAPKSPEGLVCIQHPQAVGCKRCPHRPLVWS